jgi:hypothetical protein
VTLSSTEVPGVDSLFLLSPETAYGHLHKNLPASFPAINRSAATTFAEVKRGRERLVSEIKRKPRPAVAAITDLKSLSKQLSS